MKAAETAIYAELLAEVAAEEEKAREIAAQYRKNEVVVESDDSDDDFVDELETQLTKRFKKSATKPKSTTENAVRKVVEVNKEITVRKINVKRTMKQELSAQEVCGMTEPVSPRIGTNGRVPNVPLTTVWKLLSVKCVMPLIHPSQSLSFLKKCQLH